MNPWINYHHLYYFKIIAEEGSVSRAAERLRLGQPTLSAQLKQFESALGVQLFERKHKRLVLSEQGRIALDYARNIFRLGSEMYEVLNDRIRPSRVSVTIGALDGVAKNIVLQLVQASLKVTPCHIVLVEGKSDELLRELSSHRLDICLTNFVPTAIEAKGLLHRVISHQNVMIFGAPKFKNLRKNFPHSISKQPMIVPTYDSKLRYDLDHWSKVHKLDFDVAVESQDVSVKKLLATNGVGLIAAAAHTVSSQLTDGELVELGTLAGVYEDIILVSAQRKIENPVAKALMSSFKI